MIQLRILTLLLMTCCSMTIVAQEETVTLEDVFKKGTFSQKSIHAINWMKDGQYYSSLVDNGQPKVVKINIATGKEEAVLFDGEELGINFSGYSLNSDETKALIVSEEESIYRRSSKGVFHVVDLATGELQELMDGQKISYATLSPDNTKVAFVMDNNLYYVELGSNKVNQVTHDGKWNHIINGSADWVYEEEFSMAQAFKWSPNGKKIAFLRFDESEVPEFNMQTWGPLYPQDYKFKYPKAGEKNAEVSIHVHSLDLDETIKVDTGSEKDIYLPRIYWTGDSKTLAFIRLNRLQNQMDLFHSNTDNGESKSVLKETADTYVDLNYNDNLQYLTNGNGFVRTSEQDGYKHIYHHDMNGKLISQVTTGDWEVTELVGMDEARQLIYFISTEVSPLERNLYVIQLNGKNKELLTPEKGTHEINMSKDFKYFIGYYSTAAQPLKITLNQSDGKPLKVLEENEALKERLSTFDLSQKEFFQFETLDGTTLNGYLLKPTNFDKNKQYPVIMYVYGGPGSQTVTNEWGGSRDFWHQHLAAQGFIVASIDNRGTGARGRDFKHITYANLGEIETKDQIEGAKYLGSLPFVDSDRIGIWGWSYGGYMSS